MAYINITIGGLTLDESYAAQTKVAYEYYKSKSGEIIGGKRTFTISGNVNIGDNDTLTGATVMSKLKALRDLGKDPSCINVSLGNLYSGFAKISNVSIEQGSDPTWVNVGAFSIDLDTKLDSLPQNSLGITLTDFVTDFTRSESIQLGEDSHGYILTENGLSKSFVKFTNKITVTCKPLCPSDGTPIAKAKEVINRLKKIGPTNPEFAQYSSWKQYMQTRSLDANPDGTISFTVEMILLPTCANFAAFVDLNFGYNKTYDGNTEVRSINGSINGLASINWSNLVSVDQSAARKFDGANAAMSFIKANYNTLAKWAGLIQDLTKQPNCPLTLNNPFLCGDATDIPLGGCIKPSSTNISTSRTDGNINFNFQWDNNQSNCEINGIKNDITIDINEPENKVATFTIPRYGTVIQNLKTVGAKKVNVTVNTTSESAGCTKDVQTCARGLAFGVNMSKYFPNGKYTMTSHTEASTLSSYTVRLEYTSLCP